MKITCKWRSSTAENKLRVLRRDAVRGDVLDLVVIRMLRIVGKLNPYRSSCSGSWIRPPTIPRLVAQHPPRLLDRQERLIRREGAFDGNVGKDFREQLGIWSGHHRVGVGDDEDLSALDWRFDRF